MTKFQQGFSLLETIISIVTLSFISIFILEMYMSASNLSNRAKDVDIATTEAISAIENIKSFGSFDLYLAAEKNAVQLDDIVIVNRFYNADWELLDIGTDSIINYISLVDTNALRVFCKESMDAYYHLSVLISVADAAHSGLFEIKSQVTDISRIPQANELILVDFGTKKYFARGYDYEN